MDLPCNATTTSSSSELPRTAATQTSASENSSSLLELIAHYEQALKKCDSDIRNTIDKMTNHLTAHYEQALHDCDSDIHNIFDQMWSQNHATIKELSPQLKRLTISRECQIAFLVVLYPLAKSTKTPGDEDITTLLEEATKEPESTIPQHAEAALQEYKEHRKILRGHETKIRELAIPELVSRSDDPDLPDTITSLDNQCAAVVEKLKLLWPRVRDFRMKYDYYPALDCLTDIILKHFFEAPMQWKPPKGHRFFPGATGTVSASTLQKIARHEDELQKVESNIRDLLKHAKEPHLEDMNLKLFQHLKILKIVRNTRIIVLQIMCAENPDKQHADDSVTVMLDEYFRDKPEELATLSQTYKEHDYIIQTNQYEISMLVGGLSLDLDEDELAFLDRECLKIFKELYALAIKIYQSDSKASAAEHDTSKDKRSREDSESHASPDKKTKKTPASPTASPTWTPDSPPDHYAFPPQRQNSVDPWPFLSDFNPMCDKCGKVFDDHPNVGRQLQFHKRRWCSKNPRVVEYDLPNDGGSYTTVFDP